MDKDLEYMRIAYNEALKALKLDEVPIGAIIVKDDEIIAIEEAEKKLDNWHLDDCTLYTTLEPCLMCSGAIIQSRIKRVVYGASEKRWSSLSNLLKTEILNHYPEITENIFEKECSMIISLYFKQKRSKRNVS